MPFKSEAQRRFLWMKHPDIAKRWADEYPDQGMMPMHADMDEKKKAKMAAMKALMKRRK